MEVGDLYIWNGTSTSTDIIKLTYIDSRTVEYVYTEWECNGERERTRFERSARPLTKLDTYLILGKYNEV
jgi:hypothetical protein